MIQKNIKKIFLAIRNRRVLRTPAVSLLLTACTRFDEFDATLRSWGILKLRTEAEQYLAA